MEKGFLTIKEAAHYGSISRRTLHSFLKDAINPIPHFRLGISGRIVRIKVGDFDKWMENFKVKNNYSAELSDILSDFY